MTFEKDKMKVSKSESIRKAIMKAIDNDDMESAMELVEHWDSQFPFDNEGRCIFYLTKLKVLLRCYELTNNADEKVRIITKAIETGNNLFSANEAEGFPMDSEVQLMWFKLIDYSAGLISYYSYDCSSDEDEDDYLDSDVCIEEPYPNIFAEAIEARIGKINHPRFKGI